MKINTTVFKKLQENISKAESSHNPEPKDKISLGNNITFEKLPSLKELKDLCKPLSNAHTRERSQLLIEKKKDGIREEIVINNEKHMHTICHGVPPSVKQYNPKGVTFRHYFQTQEQKDNALSINSLIAGPVSYAQVGGGVRYDYPDLVGVFLTKPDIDPKEVGVAGHNVFVDMALPEDTPVLEIEPGKIYLIPGDPKRPDWIVDYYNKFKAGQDIPEYMIPTLKKIDETGGIKEATKVYFYPVNK